MKRFMGSKRSILDAMFSYIQTEVSTSDVHFIDGFGGSCAVSQRASQLGWHTYTSDVMAVSRELAYAYTMATTKETFIGLLDEPAKSTHKGLVEVFKLLENAPESTHKVFQTFYCEGGDRSEFITNRGRQAKRLYFSDENAVLIDNALDLIREWWKDNKLERVELALILGNFISNVEKVANIKGTYGMPAAKMQPEAERPLPFGVHPDFSGGPAGGVAIGDKMDVLDFVKQHQDKDVLYLDPPYNFRIYRDYYHIPSFIADYPFITDIVRFSDKFTWARGQNVEGRDEPKEKRLDRFNNAKSVYAALQEVIEASRAKHVFLSYFDGVNHDNDFDSEDNGQSWNRMRTMFESLEDYGEPEAWEIPRKNMSSQKGRTRKEINEYLIHVERKS